jgi:peptidoglycan lytic transglycosylase G
VEDAPRRVDRHDPVDRPRRARFVALLVGFLLLVGTVVAVGTYYGRCRGADGPPHDTVEVTIPDGASGGEVLTILKRAGVIRCDGLVGGMLLRNTGHADEIRAGAHELTTNMTIPAAVDVLISPEPEVPTVQITIPEGYRITQIADRARDDLGIPRRRFLREADSGEHALPPYLPEGTPTVEGFLFPKTYEFVEGDATADALIRTMLDQFATEVDGLPWSNAQRLGVTPYEAVVIASMIEREARVPGDRAKIAAVIYNRLEEGMTLGIDATLLYDDPTPDGQLSASDLEYDSPYNTRINPGLPPTPIASPGLPSLRAALSPAHVPYLYYVLCGADGAHRFSVDYDTFLADKAECLG